MFIKLRVSSKTLNGFWEDGADVFLNVDRIISFEAFDAGRVLVRVSDAPEFVANHPVAEVQALLAGVHR